MFRRLCIAALLAGPMCTAATAQTTIGPAIAYHRAAAGPEIFLTNPDGSGTIRLYSGPKKSHLGFMDIAPGGGRIAFAQSNSGLNILSYSASGVISLPATRIDEGCYVEGIDWSADGSKILYSTSCSSVGRIKVYTVGAGSASILDVGLTSVRWGRDGTSIFYLKPAGAGRQLIWRQLSTGREVVLHSTGGFSSFDVGRISNSILLADGDAATIRRIDFPAAFPAEGETANIIVTDVKRGTSPHFSPNDSEFLFETPHSARGDYYKVNQADGTDRTITPKGNYGQSDWAPPPAP